MFTIYEVIRVQEYEGTDSLGLFTDKEEAHKFRLQEIRQDHSMNYPKAELHDNYPSDHEVFISWHDDAMGEDGLIEIIYQIRERQVKEVELYPVGTPRFITVSAGPQEYEGMKPITAETRHRWVAPADDVQKRLDAEHLEQFDVT